MINHTMISINARSQPFSEARGRPLLWIMTGSKGSCSEVRPTTVDGQDQSVKRVVQFAPEQTFIDAGELALYQRITSSARSRIDSGIVMPSALAVFRLTTSSNLVGCSIGKSLG